MIFSSLTFLLIFLPITLFLYYVVPHWMKNAALARHIPDEAELL